MPHHAPRKRFGQHFLTDSAITEAIVAAIDPKPGQALIEIGPGLGAMTEPLLARSERLTVVELDRDLAARLRRNPALEVIEADVLNVDFGGLAAARQQPLRIVGNLPYNISTPILFHLLEVADQVADQHFMLQWRYDIELLFEVPPESFDPPPRVDSAVVRMLPLPGVAGVDAGLLGEIVTVAFSQRRKLLRHTLGRWFEARGVQTGFDLQRRAEEVPVAEYLALVQACAVPAA